MISIIYEDDDIIVINKPAGIIVNRADTTKGEVTVQDWAEEKLGIKYEVSSNTYNNKEEKEEIQNTKYLIQDTFYQRGGIVHRLDKETSGILLLAKNPQAFSELQRQFKERIVKKTYLALAHGLVLPTEGEINVPVGRLPWNRKQFGVIAGGREAITKYKVLSSKYYESVKENLSLVELYPETGRTHQIRVHLKYIGYPIFGDYLYAGRKTQRDDRTVLSRVFLHAAKISFIHPTNKKDQTFESTLPEELNRIIQEEK
jgi:23S rRNA pseudouridine1911/1915/1917 synthase